MLYPELMVGTNSFESVFADSGCTSVCVTWRVQKSFNISVFISATLDFFEIKRKLRSPQPTGVLGSAVLGNAY